MNFLDKGSKTQPQKAFIQHLTKGNALREDTFTAAKMTKILEMLIDGKWHTLKEIKQKTSLNENQIQQVTEFLKRYGFISVDKMARKIILNESVTEFLVENSTS